jgi:DNA replication protein DnaC
LNNNVEVTKRDCLGCGEEFESRTFLVCGVRINLDRGFCPACRDKKAAELAAREEAERLAGIARKRREWRYGCGMPIKFMNEEFGTFESERQPRAYKKCVAYAEHFPLLKPRGYPSLVSLSAGDWGVGKTHLVCSIIHHILNRWNGEEISCPVLFITEPDLFRRIQATYNIPPEERAWHETENDVFNQLIRVPLLILDDVGKEERADPRFVQRVLFAIIDGRYRLTLPIVLTTNLSPEQLSAHLGGERGNEASYDRLVEMTGGKFIQLKGESYRRLKGGTKQGQNSPH